MRTSDGHARGHELDDVEQDHADDAWTRGAERDPHGDFARAGRDHQTDDAVDAERGQQQRHAAGDAAERRTG